MDLFQHWIFGSFQDFKFSDEVLPTKIDIIRRYLNIKINRHGSQANVKAKNKVLSEISDEIIKLWKPKNVPLKSETAIFKSLQSLLTIEKNTNGTKNLNYAFRDDKYR